MPAKWKIFRILNYLHITGTTCVMLYMFYNIWLFRFDNIYDLLGFLIVLTGVSILLGNCFINLYILDRFFPDQLPGNKLYNWSIAVFIMYLFMIVVVFLLWISIFKQFRFKSHYTGYDRTRVINLILFSVIFLTAIPISWLQVNLRRTIRRNYQHSIDNFLTGED